MSVDLRTAPSASTLTAPSPSAPGAMCTASGPAAFSIASDGSPAVPRLASTWVRGTALPATVRASEQVQQALDRAADSFQGISGTAYAFHASIMLRHLGVLADGLSLLIILPLALIGIDAWRERRLPPKHSPAEWASMIAIVICGSIVVFAQSQYPFLFLACPLVLYAAFRTGMNGTAIAVLIVTAIASIATSLDTGPITLVRGSIEDKLFAFQIFLASNFAIGLPVAAMLEGRIRDFLASQ